MSQKKPDLETPPSEEFMDAVCCHHSAQIVCEFCERVHYAPKAFPDGEDDTELREIARRMKESPDRYVCDTVNDGVSWGYLDGLQIVWGCPCNRASRYEEFVWTHRHVIAQYLEMRANRELEEARVNVDVAAQAAGAVAALENRR